MYMDEKEYRGLSREEIEAYGGATVREVGTDSGSAVRQVMTKTFLFMLAALLISGGAAIYASTGGFLLAMMENRYLFMGLLIAEVVIVMVANRILVKGAVVPAVILLVVYSVINGLTLSIIFMAYELGSITSIFAMTAAIFGILALVGIFTKMDLTSIGSIGIVGLFGIIIMSVFNIFFFKSSGMSLVLNILGLAIFIGLTMYDAQKIKKMAIANEGTSTTTLALFGALNLYLDFVNIFLRLLALFGKRR